MDENLVEKPHSQADDMTTTDLIAEENSAASNNTINTNPASGKETPKEALHKADLIVGGFIFATPEDAEVARQELHKIEYLEKKMNYHLPENILSVYNKVMESKMLKTPLGLNYLYRMQTNMRKVGIDSERITPIPIYNSFAPKAHSEITEGIARQRIERQLKREKSETEKLKGRFKVAIYFCLLFAGLIFAMFYMTLKSENPNILNYENNLIDKYAAWEQELKEREDLIREKESEAERGIYGKN